MIHFMCISWLETHDITCLLTLFKFPIIIAHANVMEPFRRGAMHEYQLYRQKVQSLSEAASLPLINDRLSVGPVIVDYASLSFVF